jgi:hypothetical protein
MLSITFITTFHFRATPFDIYLIQKAFTNFDVDCSTINAGTLFKVLRVRHAFVKKKSRAMGFLSEAGST